MTINQMLKKRGISKIDWANREIDVNKRLLEYYTNILDKEIVVVKFIELNHKSFVEKDLLFETIRDKGDKNLIRFIKSEIKNCQKKIDKYTKIILQEHAK